jgi:hypothetical protein
LSRYDPAQEHYLGALSDDRKSLAKSGTFAYGGAGVILSRAVALRLQSILPNAVHGASEKFSGDGLLADLVMKQLKVPFTPVPDLHQVDIQGDISGFMHSTLVTPAILSLHHISYWNVGLNESDTMPFLKRIFRAQSLLGPYFLKTYTWNDPKRNHSTQLKLGYSMIQYSNRYYPWEIEKASKTYRGNLVGVKQKTKDVNAIQWHLLEAHEERDGFRLIYRHPQYRDIKVRII